MERRAISLTISDGIGTIRFDRAEALNAVSDEIAIGLIDYTGQCERDPDVRCVLINAAGDHFMAGGDVKGFHRSLTEDRDGHLAAMEQRVVTGHLALHRIRRMAKPVVVAVQGKAAGFGCSIALAADLAIAADDATFLAAYRNIGLSADGGMSYFLPRMVGERRALQFILGGEPLSAAQALDWGMVNWVVPRGDLDARAAAICADLASGASLGLGAAKKLLRQSLDTGWDEQSAREAEVISGLMATDDHLEGLTAFIERRRPHFSGR